MSIGVVFETHALSEDNERGIATGWLPGRLSTLGRDNAGRRVEPSSRPTASMPDPDSA
jgi:hypothetical protein